MKAIRVQYKVQESYVNQNKVNIKAVMDELISKNIQGINYSSYYLGDGNFMHLNISKDELALAKFNTVESFIEFRTQLKASGPVIPPKSEDIEVVGANFELG